MPGDSRGLVCVVFLLSALGCSGGSGSDADAAVDSGSGGLPNTCTDDCAAVELVATFGSAIRTFERAYFGVTRAAGGYELYVEAYGGGVEGCPTEASPSPDRTLVVTGVRVPGELVDTGAAVSLLDFEGALLPLTPVASAETSRIDWLAADPCPDCSDGAPEPALRFLAFDFEAGFEAGSIGGHVFATHCDSLDEL